MNISVANLDNNVSLDSEAMIGVLGGWHNHSTTVAYGNYASTGWSAWMNTGIPFTKKRYRDRYRTKYIKIRQHQRDRQFKVQIRFGF